MDWALPYAQRYLYSMHPDKYSELKQSGFDFLSLLRVVVVEKLFYINVIKSCGSASEKRVECSCLLHVCLLSSIICTGILHLLAVKFNRFSEIERIKCYCNFCFFYKKHIY